MLDPAFVGAFYFVADARVAMCLRTHQATENANVQKWYARSEERGGDLSLSPSTPGQGRRLSRKAFTRAQSQLAVMVDRDAVGEEAVGDHPGALMHACSAASPPPISASVAAKLGRAGVRTSTCRARDGEVQRHRPPQIFAAAERDGAPEALHLRQMRPPTNDPPGEDRAEHRIGLHPP